jgi:hypothetical protein
MRYLNDFITGESGAVSVDWVVLTGATIGLGVAVMTSVATGTVSLGDKIETALADSTIASYPGLPGLGAQSSYTSSGGTVVCAVAPCPGPYYFEETTAYAMSDDSEWRHYVYSTGASKQDQFSHGTISTDIWFNGDNEIVDAPEGFNG